MNYHLLEMIAKTISKMIKILKTIIVVFLLVNLVPGLANLGYTADIIEIYKHKDEYVKTKVLVDSLVQEGYRQPMGGGVKYYAAYYSNPKGRVIAVANDNSIHLEKNELPYLNQLFNYHHDHNDSIYVWHHPTLPDDFVLEKHKTFEDTIFNSETITEVVSNIITILTLVFLFIVFVRYRIKKWKQKKKGELGAA